MLIMKCSLCCSLKRRLPTHNLLALLLRYISQRGIELCYFALHYIYFDYTYILLITLHQMTTFQ